MQKTNAMRLLDKANIPYHIFEYGNGDFLDAITVASIIGQSVDKVYKTLVTQGASKNYFVFVIGADKELDLKKAAKAVGEKSVQMIKASEIQGVTGYIKGGCSPIGMKKQMNTIIDMRAEHLETIIVSAGKRGIQLEISPKDLVTAVHAMWADVVKETI